MRMPRGSGLDVQAELARRGSRLPVIAMTGGDNIEEAEQSMAMGAIDMLEKPFEEAALMAALKTGFEALGAKSSVRLS
jgi:two-component system response regulator FixJ